MTAIVERIADEVKSLPRAQLDELLTWLEEYRQRAWDQQIEDDLAAGRLDGLIAEANEEYRQGLAQPL